MQAMKSHYRMIVTGAERKFARSPFRVVNISGGAAFLEVFTDEMYQLYVNVVAHADIVMHVLPAEYFCAIARHFGEQFLSTIVYRGEKPVAFAVGIVTKEAYYGLFIGLDYTAKQEADLYFNLFYETLRYAMRRRVRHVYMGSDSDRFKLRLGCRPRESQRFHSSARPIGPAVSKDEALVAAAAPVRRSRNGRVPCRVPPMRQIRPARHGLAPARRRRQ